MKLRGWIGIIGAVNLEWRILDPNIKSFGASAATSNFNGLPFPKDMAETVPIVLNFGIQASKGARSVLWLSEPEAFSEDMSENFGRP